MPKSSRKIQLSANFEVSPVKRKCQEQQTKQKTNVIWFNPPFSVNLKTKVRYYFLNLIRKHFPPRHKFSKLLNRSTIKVTYSCMPNIKAEIHKHNKDTLEKAQQKDPDTRLCKCTNKKQCPFKRKMFYYEHCLPSKHHGKHSCL